MSDKSQIDRRQQYLQEHWEELDISTEEVSSQPSNELRQTKVNEKVCINIE
jgi:hypothetical protein